VSLPGRDTRPSRGPLAGTAALAAALAVGAAAAAHAPRPASPRPAPALVRAHAAGSAAGWAASAARVYAEVDRSMRRAGDGARVGVARAVLEEARRAGVDPLVVTAVIHVESSFDPRAVSPVGAVGLMQLMLPTLAEESRRSGLRAADPFDAVANVRAGVRYLARLQRAFGNLDVALMAYNAGPGRIRGHLRAGGIPRRFHTYPRKVESEVVRLRGGTAAATPLRLASSRVLLRAAAPFAAASLRADARATPSAMATALPPDPHVALAADRQQRLRTGRSHVRRRRAARRRQAARRGPPRTGRRGTLRHRGAARGGRVR
jgi:hypothetical protein